MKKSLLFLLCSIGSFSFAQTTSDIFSSSDYNYTYLGIDYSHTKFVGGFSQFFGSGTKGVVSIKEDYFVGWNNVVNNERDKYNLRDALRKESITYDLSAISEINANTPVEEMEGAAVTYTKEDIQEFINNSDYGINEGIGILFIGEYLSKPDEKACFHFVMISLETKEILLHERMENQPGGFGLRNYWIRPVYTSIEQIKKDLYKKWKKLYVKK